MGCATSTIAVNTCASCALQCECTLLQTMHSLRFRVFAGPRPQAALAVQNIST